MRRLCLHLLLLACIAGLPLLLSGCAGRGRKQDATATMPRMIGKVSTVRDALNFVLIDSTEPLQAGQKLETMDPISRTATGKLVVSPQQSHPFFIGDIADGTPKIGDWVIHPGNAAAQASSSAGPDALPGAAPDGLDASNPSNPAAPPVLPAHLPAGVPPSLPPIPSLEPLPSLPPVPNLPPLEETP